MSGFEVAGVVLGAIPVLVEALQAYRTAHQEWKIFKRHGAHLERLLCRLQYSQMEICDSVELALESSDAPRHVAQLFLDDPAGATEWQDEISHVLRAFVGARRYSTLSTTLRLYRDSLETLALNLNDAGIARQPRGRTIAEVLQSRKNANGTFEFPSRFKFTMKRHEIAACIEDIERWTSMIVNMCKPSPLRQEFEHRPERSSSKLAAHLTNVGPKAIDLLNAIRGKWGGQCFLEHEVAMQLDHRLPSTKHRARRTVKNTAFRVGLGHSQSYPGQDIQWYIAHVSTEASGDDTDHESSLRTVQIRLPVKDDTLPGQVFTDLCALLRSTNLENQTPLFHFSRGQELRWVEHCKAKAPSICHAQVGSSSLAGLLSKRFQRPHVQQFELADRLLVGVVLASSLFQLSSTTLMSTTALKDLVFLPMQADKESNGSHEEATQVLCSPDPKNAFLHVRHAKEHSALHLDHDQHGQLLLELSIVLLELWNEELLEEHFKDTRPPDQLQSQYQRRDAAQQWLDSTRRKMILQWQEVVGTCIQRSTDHDKCLLDTEYRDELFEKIVLPLMKCTSEL